MVLLSVYDSILLWSYHLQKLMTKLIITFSLNVKGIDQHFESGNQQRPQEIIQPITPHETTINVFYTYILVHIKQTRQRMLIRELQRC